MSAPPLLHRVRRRVPAGLVRLLPDGRRRSHVRMALAARDFDRLPRIVGDRDPFESTALFTCIDALMADGDERLVPRLAPLAARLGPFERAIFDALCLFVSGNAEQALCDLDHHGSGDRFESFERMSARAWSLFLRLPRLEDLAPRPASRVGIVQFWDNPSPPDDLAAEFEHWRADSTLPYRLFDAATARAFLAETYGAMAGALFDACPHPAIKCDYFRLGWLARHGGIYVDADEGMAEGFVNTLPKLASRLVVQFTSHRPNAYFNNAFIAAPAGGSATVRAAFEEATRRLSRGTDGHPFTLAGPGVFTDMLIDRARDGQLEDAAVIGKTFLNRHLLRGIDARYKNDSRNWPVWFAGERDR